jgi:hypothetical protein
VTTPEASAAQRCLFFGCWNTPGHFLVRAGARRLSEEDYKLEYYGDRRHLDGTLAPRRMSSKYGRRGGELVWTGATATTEEGRRIGYDSEECPQGQFLRHYLSTGFTAIQWWDRCQGDKRGACNSTILLEGDHTSEEMLAALATHFPHVLENLKKAGVELVEVVPGG